MSTTKLKDIFVTHRTVGQAFARVGVVYLRGIRIYATREFPFTFDTQAQKAAEDWAAAHITDLRGDTYADPIENRRYGVTEQRS